MPLKYGVAIGMSPAAIFLEIEKDNLAQRDLLLAHAVLQQFDMFDSPVRLSGEDEVAGFRIAKNGPGIVFESDYSIRSKGIVEEGINLAYPEHKRLFTNASVDHGGYVTVRGIHANDVLKHPYIRACFELMEGEEERGDLAEIRMIARFAALDMLELPRPSKEALALMLGTMSHNGPSHRYDLRDRLEQYRSMLYWADDIEVNQYSEDLVSFAPLAMYSAAEAREMNERDRGMMAQRRSRFLLRHRGAEAIFAPIPPEDKVLAEIRDIVQTTLHMPDVDLLIEQAIGQAAWDEFLADPKAFCETRADKDEIENDMPDIK